MANPTTPIAALTPIQERRRRLAEYWLLQRDTVIDERRLVEKRRKDAVKTVNKRYAKKDRQLARRQRRAELRLRALTILLHPILSGGNQSFKILDGRTLGFRRKTHTLDIDKPAEVIKSLKRKGLLRRFGRIKWEVNAQAIKDELKQENPHPGLKRLRGATYHPGGDNAFAIDGEIITIEEETES